MPHWLAIHMDLFDTTGRGLPSRGTPEQTRDPRSTTIIEYDYRPSWVPPALHWESATSLLETAQQIITDSIFLYNGPSYHQLSCRMRARGYGKLQGLLHDAVIFCSYDQTTLCAAGNVAFPTLSDLRVLSQPYSTLGLLDLLYHVYCKRWLKHYTSNRFCDSI